MALDVICLQAVVREIAPQVEGLKIEKIQQPARDQVILLLRGSRRLLLCAGGTGNVLERLVWGRVTDYIRFPRLPGMRLGRLVWNLADFMLLAGALLLAAGGLQ